MDTLAKFKAAKEATEIFKSVELETDENLAFLANKWLGARDFKSGGPKFETTEEALERLATYEYGPNACGCMGAAPGEPWCRCMVWAKMGQQKYNVGIYIIENNLQVP